MTIVVTHDPDEAMEISDKVAIMSSGKIIQTGSPSEIYQSPKSLAVAQLTSEGSGLEAEITNDKIISEFGHWSEKAFADHPVEGKVDIYIRPFTTSLREISSGEGVKIIDIRPTGFAQIVSLESKSGHVLSLQIETGQEYTIGQIVKIIPKPKTWLCFSR